MSAGHEQEGEDLPELVPGLDRPWPVDLAHLREHLEDVRRHLLDVPIQDHLEGRPEHLFELLDVRRVDLADGADDDRNGLEETVPKLGVRQRAAADAAEDVQHVRHERRVRSLQLVSGSDDAAHQRLHRMVVLREIVIVQRLEDGVRRLGQATPERLRRHDERHPRLLVVTQREDLLEAYARVGLQGRILGAAHVRDVVPRKDRQLLRAHLPPEGVRELDRGGLHERPHIWRGGG